MKKGPASSCGMTDPRHLLVPTWQSTAGGWMRLGSDGPWPREGLFPRGWTAAGRRRRLAINGSRARVIDLRAVVANSFADAVPSARCPLRLSCCLPAVHPVPLFARRLPTPSLLLPARYPPCPSCCPSRPSCCPPAIHTVPPVGHSPSINTAQVS